MYKSKFPYIFNYVSNGKEKSILCWESHNINIMFDYKFEGSLRDFLNNTNHDLSDIMVEQVIEQYEKITSFNTKYSIDDVKNQIEYVCVDGIPEILHNYFNSFHSIDLYEGHIGRNMSEMTFTVSKYFGIISIDGCPTVQIHINTIQVIDELKWAVFIDYVMEGIKQNLIESMESSKFTQRFPQYIECSKKGSGTHSFDGECFIESNGGDFVKFL